MAELKIEEFKNLIKDGYKFISNPIFQNDKWDLRLAAPKEIKNGDPIFKYERYYMKDVSDKLTKVLKSIRPNHPYYLKPSHYGIILIDVKGFSTKDTFEQINIVNYLYAIISYVLAVTNYRSKGRPTIVTTGDGCYIIYPSAESVVIPLMAINYRNAYSIAPGQSSNVLRSLYDEDIRICCHIGPAIQLRDITGNVNFIGEGMNDCARLGNVRTADYPDFDEKSDIIVSVKAYDDLMKFRKENCPYAPWPYNFKADGKIQYYNDKHGKKHPFYILTPITSNLSFMRLPKSSTWMLGSGWTKDK